MSPASATVSVSASPVTVPVSGIVSVAPVAVTGSVSPAIVTAPAPATVSASSAMVTATVPTKVTAPVPTSSSQAVSYTHLRAHETREDLVCRLLLEKKNPLF